MDLEAAAERPDPHQGPEALLLIAIDAEAALAAMATLSPEYREALALRVWEELSYAQIAEALLITPGLARWRCCPSGPCGALRGPARRRCLIRCSAGSVPTCSPAVIWILPG